MRLLAALLAFAAGASGPVDVVRGGGYFPVAIRLRSGAIAAVLRGGAAHLGVGGRLDLVVSRDGARTWSAPRTVVDGPQDDRNPAFGQLPDGTLLVAYAVAGGYDESGRHFRKEAFDGVYLTRSADEGRTWSKPERIPATWEAYRGHGAVSPYGKIVRLRDGTVLLSVYYAFPGERGNQAWIFRSRDAGRTWGDPSLVGRRVNETALVELPDGKLLAAMRTEQGGRILMASSRDGGRTWSEPTALTAEREHPGDLLLLENGTLVLAYGERNAPYGVRALVSRDGGLTWPKENAVALAETPAPDCGYPSSVALPDGRVLTVYYQVDDPAKAPASARARAVFWKP